MRSPAVNLKSVVNQLRPIPLDKIAGLLWRDYGRIDSLTPPNASTMMHTRT
jgi:hypothetical protein